MTTTTQPRFEAEITFSNPYDASAAVARLTEAGFDVEVMDLVDYCGTPCVWAIAMCKPGRDDDELRSEVWAIVEPLNGDVNQAGTSNIPIKEVIAEHDATVPTGPWMAKLEAAAAVERKQAGIEYRVYPAVQH